MRIQLFRSLVYLVLVLCPSVNTFAQGSEATPKETSSVMAAMNERLARQEERIMVLEDLVREQLTLIVEVREELDLVRGNVPSSSAREIGEKGAPNKSKSTLSEAPKPQLTQNAGWTSSHAYVNSEDGDFKMQFSGRMHMDIRGYTNKETPDPTLAFRRARITLEGNLYDNYSFKIQTDFADRGSSMVRDAYLNAKFNSGVQLRFGQFKAPFSQETLQSSNLVNFVDRSSLSALAPGRSPGIMLHGSFLRGGLSYGISVSNGLGILNDISGSSPEVVGRVRLKPFQNSELFKGFAFGGAYGRGNRDSGKSFRGRTASRSVTFFDRVPISGKITRTNAEFEWLLPKWAIRGEFNQANQSRDGLGTNGENLPAVLSKGYMFNAAYVFGGETRSNSAVVPYTTFLKDGGAGALQLVFRYENLQIDDRVNTNRGTAYTVGFNWWLSKFVRYQSNFVFEGFQNPNRTGRFNGERAFTYLGRMQLVF